MAFRPVLKMKWSKPEEENVPPETHCGAVWGSPRGAAEIHTMQSPLRKESTCTFVGKGL